jgi:hypothetical protein
MASTHSPPPHPTPFQHTHTHTQTHVHTHTHLLSFHPIPARLFTPFLSCSARNPCSDKRGTDGARLVAGSVLAVLGAGPPPGYSRLRGALRLAGCYLLSPHPLEMHTSGILAATSTDEREAAAGRIIADWLGDAADAGGSASVPEALVDQVGTWWLRLYVLCVPAPLALCTLAAVCACTLYPVPCTLHLVPWLLCSLPLLFCPSGMLRCSGCCTPAATGCAPEHACTGA